MRHPRDLSKEGENGSTVSTIGSDSQGNFRANSDVTINSKMDGDSYAGSHGTVVVPWAFVQGELRSAGVAATLWACRGYDGC
jgi:hypothetical protein